jgi:Smg protein
MIDVLMYLYETYWRPDACPEPEQLSKKLSAVGFERDEIDEALAWLHGLAHANSNPFAARVNDGASKPLIKAQRIYTPQEQAALGVEGTNILTALELQGKLEPGIRELIVDRVLASGQSPIDPDDLKVMLLIVCWCLDQEPDALILDDLFEDPEAQRTYH